jgi:1-acyl-sn-glycerol-3-phosphate acyltransferase
MSRAIRRCLKKLARCYFAARFYNRRMPEDVRVLRLGEMLLRQKGSPARRLVRAIISIALRLFFRRIETSDAGHVPEAGACVFVINHPNGLIDPALVFCALPRRISFLAKSTLFRLPVIGYTLRTVEALPLYRRVDAGEDPRQNVRTFEACQQLLRQGRCIALFPEGLSHNETQLLPIKSGAARIALGAISVGSNEAEEGASGMTLKIAPVGLYYTSKTSFRSEALLRFGEPLEVAPVELDESGEPPREAVRELSARIERALREVTINVETDEELEVAVKAGQLFASLEEGLDIEQSLAARFAFLSRFTRAAPQAAHATPEQSAALRGRILAYEEELRGLGLAPENLSLSRHSKWYVLRHFLLRGALLLLLLPLSLPGALLHLPAYLLSTLLARLFTKHGVDEATSTVKILAAVALMPLTWLVLAALCYYFWGWRAAVAALPLSVLCGYVAMRSLEELYDMRGWLKAVVVLVQRRGLFLRLLFERRSLHRELARAGDEREAER